MVAGKAATTTVDTALATKADASAVYTKQVIDGYFYSEVAAPTPSAGWRYMDNKNGAYRLGLRRMDEGATSPISPPQVLSARQATT